MLADGERYGLVLGGGGLRGAYEVGVAQALQELDIPIGGVSGTSIGALNGAMIVQGDVGKLNELYQQLKISTMVEIKAVLDPEKDFFSPGNLRQVLKEMIANRGFDNQPLRELILQYLDVGKVYQSQMDFGVVTYSLRDFKPAELFKEDIEQEQLIDYLLASACSPIFKAQKINDKAYIDGCVYDNMPINMLARKGYEKIIAVDLDSYTPVRKPYRRDIYVKLISPREDLGGTFEFNPKRITRNIKLGYLDAMRAFYHYQGHVYYFPREQFQHLLAHFELETIYGLEFAAQVYKLPKLRVYQADEFLEKLYQKHLDAKQRYQELFSEFSFDDLGKRSKLLSSLMRKGLAICWFEEMFSARPLARHALLARTFSSYATAATSMLELEHYRNTAKICPPNPDKA